MTKNYILTYKFMWKGCDINGIFSFICTIACSRYAIKDILGFYMHISISDMQNLPTNAFLHSELIIYGACSTAQGGLTGNNIVMATIDAGARTVIGFENSVYSDGCNRWCANFFEMYALYYNNPSKSILDVCYETDLIMQNDSSYEYISEDGYVISLRNYVVAGQYTFY